MEYGLIDLPSHVAYERLGWLLNLEYPRVGRCEWCAATGLRTDYAVGGPGRYSRNRAGRLEPCNWCHIYFDGPLRRLMAPRLPAEMTGLRTRQKEFASQQSNGVQDWRRRGRHDAA
jgi:hypothetical protein